MTIEAVNRLASRWIARCDALFAATGGWARRGVPGQSDSAVSRRTCAEWSARAAELTVAWRQRLPVIPHHQPALSSDEAAGVATMAEQLTAELTAGPAALATQVGPALIATVDRDAQSIDALVDGPTAVLLARTRAELSAAVDAFAVPPSDAPTGH